MLFIELHAPVVLKNMLAKPIETSSPDLTNMIQHLSNCRAFNDHIMLFLVPDAATNTTVVNNELHLHNVVINDVVTLNKIDRWDQH